MKITITENTKNEAVLNRARITVWKEGLSKEPSVKFMEDIYKSEHSPIRAKTFTVQIRGIKSWVATHFVRHSIGVTPFVGTQRDDRLDYEGSRDDRGQGQLVDMDLDINAQAFINISRKRICGQSHIETQKVWNEILKVLKEIDRPLWNNCVPECVYRGFCPEKPCGRTELKLYKQWRKYYVGDRPVISID